MIIGKLNMYSDFEPEVAITRKNATTGAKEAATGLTSVTAWIALTPTGAAIAGLTVTLAERGTTGIYAGVLDTAALVTGLLTLLGTTVYVVYTKAGDIGHEWAAYTVVDNRYVGA